MINESVATIISDAGEIHRVKVPVLFTARVDGALADGLAYTSNFANLARLAGQICLTNSDKFMEPEKVR